MVAPILESIPNPLKYAGWTWVGCGCHKSPFQPKALVWCYDRTDLRFFPLSGSEFVQVPPHTPWEYWKYLLGKKGCYKQANPLGSRLNPTRGLTTKWPITTTTSILEEYKKYFQHIFILTHYFLGQKPHNLSNFNTNLDGADLSLYLVKQELLTKLKVSAVNCCQYWYISFLIRLKPQLIWYQSYEHLGNRYSL